MGLKLVDLLRWSREVTLKDDKGKAIERDGKEVKVWLRIIGDQDLEDAYKAARAASARQRATLRDRNSDDFLSGIAIMLEADETVCKTMIMASKSRGFSSEAYANVVRPELPKLEEVAVDADAPTLEEQEKLDALIDESNAEYLKSLDEYIKTKKDELASELETLSLDELRDQAVEAMIEVQVLEVFIKELDAQKTARAVYMDKLFKERAFDTVNEFKQFKLNDQLISEYDLLELSPDDVKN